MVIRPTPVAPTTAAPVTTHPALEYTSTTAEHSDAPPSYDDIYPSNSTHIPAKIPGDNKVQHGEDGPNQQDWESDSSVPSIDSSDLSSSENEGSDGDSILVQALEFTSHPVPKSAQTNRLSKPIAIPQEGNGSGQPFVRAYSAQLAYQGIRTDEFVAFIDNLNVVSAVSPPSQVIDLVNGILGVRLPAVSKTWGTNYIRKVNEDFFAPRGLRVELMTEDALRVKLGMAPNAFSTTLMETPKNRDSNERRIAALKGYVSDDLTFEVPPPNPLTDSLSKMYAIQRKAVLARHGKRKAKYHRNLENHGEGSEKAQHRLERDLQKLEYKLEKMEMKRERKLEKILSKVDQKVQDKVARVETRKEHRLERKLNKVDRKLDRKLERLERKHNRKATRIDRDLLREHQDHSKETKKPLRDQYESNHEVKEDKALWIYIDNL